MHVTADIVCTCTSITFQPLYFFFFSFHTHANQQPDPLHNMDASPFGKLPRELRDEVYQLALYQTESIEVFYPESYFLKKPSERRPKQPLPSHPVNSLTTVCKKIRAESLSVFYAINTFRFTVDPLRMNSECVENEGETVGRWIKNIGLAGCTSLRNVELALNLPTSYPGATSIWCTATEIGASHDIVKLKASKAVITLIIDTSFIAKITECMPDELRLPFADLANEAVSVVQTIKDASNHVSALGRSSRPRGWMILSSVEFAYVKVWTWCFLEELTKIVE